MGRYLPLMGLLLLGACATQPLVMRFEETPGAGVTVWPASPEVARYRYLGQLTGENNFSPAEQSAPSTGEKVLRWLVGLGQRFAEPRVLLRPQSGMVDPLVRRTYVTDMGRQAVFVFDQDAGELRVWDRADGNQSFLSPVGIAPGRAGEILVADAGLARVVRLDAAGVPRGSFGAGELARPTGLAHDPAGGRFYVADTGAHDIKVFGDDGQLLDRFGRRGGGPGEFNAPTHLAFRAGRLYVADTLNARIQVLGAGGEPLAQIGRRGLFVGNLTRPKGVALDNDGNVYVVESYYDHLLIFDGGGRFLLPIGGSGSAVGQFYLPAGVWSDGRDRIYVADMFNGRVIVMQYLGG